MTKGIEKKHVDIACAQNMKKTKQKRKHKIKKKKRNEATIHKGINEKKKNTEKSLL